MEKRSITVREEQAYRLCHSDFDGLPLDQAAEKMGISRKAVLRLLKSVECKAPQLTPVLTPRQRLILMLAGDNGQNSEQIAALTGLPGGYIRKIITFLETHGFVMPKSKTLGYTPGVDGRVTERF